jgi:hypothetical protein
MTFRPLSQRFKRLTQKTAFYDKILLFCNNKQLEKRHVSLQCALKIGKRCHVFHSSWKIKEKPHDLYNTITPNARLVSRPCLVFNHRRDSLTVDSLCGLGAKNIGAGAWGTRVCHGANGGFVHRRRRGADLPSVGA